MHWCPTLQVLSATIVHLDSFSAPRGIKHLILEVPEVHCGRLSSSLSVLEQLQTLWVAVSEVLEEHTAGALELSSLRALRRLRLDDFVPDSIRLGDLCELSVTQRDAWSVQHRVWDTVLPHLREVLLEDSCHDLMDLPSVLLKADNLVRADLVVDNIGTAAEPVQLHGALARVEDLFLHCTDLHAIVPANVAWRFVRLTAQNELHLRFEAVLSFAAVIPAFRFRYRTWQVCCPLRISTILVTILLPSQSPLAFLQGIAVLELVALLTKRRPEWKGQFLEAPAACGLCFPWDEPSGITWDFDCRCATCWQCLSKAGVIARL